MKITKTLSNAVIAFVFLVSLCTAQETECIVKEEFNNLNNWEEISLNKSLNKTTYAIEKTEKGSHLKIHAKNSASGIVYNKSFDVNEFPKIRWSWKIDNTIKNAAYNEKSGDDYPIRIYILFHYNPLLSSMFDKAYYELAKKIYGHYPPQNALNYVWANEQNTPEFYASPYTKKVMIVPVEKGEQNLKHWIINERNIVKDFEKVFGKTPNSKATIGIMADSDNTKSEVTSYLNLIEICK